MTERMSQGSLPGRRRSLLRGMLGAALLVPAGWVLAGGSASAAVRPAGADASTAATSAAGAASTASAGASHAAVSGGTRAGHAPRRIVSMGGTLTEIIYALGAGDQLVGTDASSLYPPEARQLPQVGYYRGFSVEGVASLHPDLVIAAAESGPPQALDGLKKLGIPLELIALKPDLDHLVERIAELAKVLDRKPEGEALVKKLRRQVADATRIKRPARVVALSNHVGRMQGAGRDTAIDSLLQMVGATNLLAGSHKGYKPMSAEAVAALQPDAIITSRLSLGDGGLAAYAAQPGIASTPAAVNRHIIVLDDMLLLGFGLRVGEALQQISEGLSDLGPAQGYADAGHVVGRTPR